MDNKLSSHRSYQTWILIRMHQIPTAGRLSKRKGEDSSSYQRWSKSLEK